MFEIDDEPELPQDGAHLRCMMTHNRQVRGVFMIYDEAKGRGRA